ncbi:MAG: SlyX family protein [Gammaproteobacteria bacterium]|nr:MAG: SlyX family protein [Gammaproteobacteria bacterium]
MESRITGLEIRLSHQEAALDELTRANHQQQQVINNVLAELQQIRIMLQQLSPGISGANGDEPPPPHY